MVKYGSAELNRIFRALADPTRRQILGRLAEGEASVGDLAEPFDVSLPAISRHLRVLEGAGLMAREKHGRVHHCRLQAAPLRRATSWLAEYRSFWEAQLDSLESFLEDYEEERWPSKRRSPKPPSSSSARSRRRPRRSSRRGRSRKR